MDKTVTLFGRKEADMFSRHSNSTTRGGEPGRSALPLDHALTYAGLGWPVFPLHTPQPDGSCSCRRDCGRDIGKHPRTLAGLSDATTDLAVIRGWWKSWPDANIGIRCGADAGIVVIDIDTHHDGWDHAERLEAEHGPFPATFTVETGTGGGHLYFAHPGGIVRPSVGKLAPGLDVRGDSSYVVAPPSLHASGKCYAWIHPLEVIEPARVPLWLVQLIARTQAPAKRTTTPGAAIPGDGDPIPEGERDKRLASLSGAMRRQGATAAEILTALEATNDRCVPPLPQAQLEKIANSIARYPPGSPAVNVPTGGIRGRRPNGAIRHGR